MTFSFIFLVFLVKADIGDQGKTGTILRMLNDIFHDSRKSNTKLFFFFWVWGESKNKLNRSTALYSECTWFHLILEDFAMVEQSENKSCSTGHMNGLFPVRISGWTCWNSAKSPSKALGGVSECFLLDISASRTANCGWRELEPSWRF